MKLIMVKLQGWSFAQASHCLGMTLTYPSNLPIGLKVKIDDTTHTRRIWKGILLIIVRLLRDIGISESWFSWLERSKESKLGFYGG